MYFKISLKQLLHKPIQTSCLFLLLTATCFLVTIFSKLYIKSWLDEKELKGNLTVTMTLKDKKMDGSTLMDLETIKLFLDDTTFKNIGANITLAGEIKNHLRLPYYLNNVPLEYEAYLKGNVTSYKEISDTYKVSIYIEETYWGDLESGNEYAFYIPKLNTINYDLFFSGASHYITSHYNSDKGIYTIGESDNDMLNVIPIKQLEDNTYYKAKYYLFDGSIDKYTDSQYKYPVLFTRNVESMENFLNKSLYLSSGNFFTEEDYINNKEICLIHQDLASRFNLKVGDTITIENIDPLVVYNPTEPYNYSPYIMPSLNGQKYVYYAIDGVLNEEDTIDKYKTTNEVILNLTKNYSITYKDYIFTTPKEYSIVGIYDNRNNKNVEYYYMNPNTIIVPTSAFPNEDILLEKSFSHVNAGSFSFEFRDPDKKDAFISYLANNNFDFETYEIVIHDNDYYSIRSIIKDIQNTATILLVVALITTIALLVTFLFLHFQSQLKIYTLCRLMGETKKNALKLLHIGIHIIFIASLLFATLVNQILSPYIINKAYDISIHNFYNINKTNYAQSLDILSSNVSMMYVLLPILLLVILYLIIFTFFIIKSTSKSLFCLVQNK